MYLISEKCLDFPRYKPYFLRSFELFAHKNCFVLIRLQFSTFQNTIHCWESSIPEVQIFKILQVFDQLKTLQFLALLTSFSRLFSIIGKQKLLYFDQTSVLYISKYQTLLGN